MTAEPPASRWPDRATDLLHVVALTTLAVAAPTFDLLGRNLAFFTARRSDRLELLLLVAVLAVVVPAVAAAPQLIACVAGERARRLTHLATVGVLSVVIALPMVVRLTDRDVVAWPLALGAGAVGLAAYRWLPRNAWTAVPCLALPLLLAAQFLVGSGAFRAVSNSAGDPGAPAAATPSSVVVVMLDELPLASLLDADGALDAARLPGFAALARDSVWYRDAAAASDDTTLATPALLTGRYPVGVPAPTTATYPRSLFTLLRRTHAMDVHEAITRICPAVVCGAAPLPPLRERVDELLADVGVAYAHMVSPRRLRDQLPDISESWGGFRRNGEAATDEAEFADLRDDQPTRAADFIAGLRADVRPTLHYLHLLLPHPVWRFLPDGRRYVRGEQVLGFSRPRWQDPAGPALGLQRHLLQLGLVDTLLGRLIARLRALGTYDRTMIVVTSDHGADFTPGELRRLVGDSSLDELAPVPLFVKYPGPAGGGRVDDGAASTIDIVPTIADVQGAAVPWSFDGGSLRDPRTLQRPSRRLVSVHGESQTFGPLTGTRAALIARNRALFPGPGRGLDPEHLVVAHPGLVGRRLADIPAAPGDLRAVLDTVPNPLSAYDPDSPVSPAYVTGRLLLGDAVAPRRLLVALNGVVTAVVGGFSGTGEVPLGFVLPPRALRRGSNVVALLAEEPVDSGRWQRVRLNLPPTYRLADDGSALVGVTGRRYPLSRGGAEGLVNRIDLGRDGSARAAGWLVDPSTPALPDRVLLVYQGRVYVTRNFLPRGDVVAKYRNGRLRASGWSVEFPAGTAVDVRALRLIGVFGDRALEVPVSPDVLVRRL